MRYVLPILFALIAFSACQDTATSKLDTKNQTAETTPFDSINTLIKATPNNPDLYFDRAKLHYSNRDLASSLSDLGRAMKLDSANVDYYLFLADLKLIEKQSRETRNALLKAYRIAPENVDVLLKLGELYMVVEDADASFKYLNEALKVDIHNAKAYRLKGFNYKYLGDTVNAVSSFQTAVEQDANDYDSYMQLGLLYSVPQLPVALDYFDNALNVRPNSIEARYAKGLLLQNTGKPRQAMAMYDEILELYPEHFDAHYNKGYLYLEQLQQYDSAATAFTNAINYGPEGYFTAVYNRGLAYERSGNAKSAEGDYRKALEINPQYDLAALGLERVLEGK